MDNWINETINEDADLNLTAPKELRLNLVLI